MIHPPLWLALTAVMAAVVPAGLHFLLQHSPTEQKYLLETMAGGVALLDYDQDGRLDIFFVNGGSLDDRHSVGDDFRRTQPAFWNRLFRQNQDGSFTDVTASVGLNTGPNAFGMGAAVGDIDNDGYPDLYVTAYGGNVLYRNEGGQRFSDITRAAGVVAGGWSVSAGFLDYDNDGLLDLFVVRYLKYDLQHNILCGLPLHTYCRPDRYQGATNLLFHNEGHGRFRDVSRESGIGAHTGNGMGLAFEDYDDDGFTDIFVANDLSPQFLFHNRRNGTFEEVALEAGVALSEDGKTYSGMGASWADYDNDGKADIVVTNLALEKWALYRNEGRGLFSWASSRSGLAGWSAPRSGWGVALADLNNDGWKDLVAACSHVLDNVERLHAGLRYREPPIVLLNQQGRFQPAEIAGAESVAGRGLAYGDLNNDGALDAVIAVLGARPMVLYGRPTPNAWLGLQLRGRSSNRDGLGAVVRAAGQRFFVTTSGSYLAAHDPRVHIGLGKTAGTDVEIRWPSGRRQLLLNIKPNQFLEVREP